MCGGEDTLKSAVPWGDVSQDPSAFFDSTQWPAGVQFKEPSKMDISDASTLLQFLFARQGRNIQPAFSFTAWQDSDGDICEAVVFPAPLHAGSNANHAHRRQQKARRAIKDSISEDELDSDNDGSSSEDDGPLFTSRRKDVTPPRQATLPVNKPKPRKMKSDPAPQRRSARQMSAAVGDVAKPVIAAVSNTKEPARTQKKAIKQPSTSLGAITRGKEVTYAADEKPRGSKRRAPDAVSDTPAKRTRSRTFAPESSLGTRGKK
jgi:hypothetical protein